MTYTEQIQELLNSDITSYQLAKQLKEKGYKTSIQFFDNYRVNKRPIKNMPLEKAEMLIEYIKNNPSQKFG